jgi:hypothetical protein
LSVMEEEQEIATLNPRSRVGGGILATLSNTASRGTTLMSDSSDDEVEVVGDNKEMGTSNSTTLYVPHHISFVYKDDARKLYVCNVISITTGLSTNGSGLDGKVRPKVSPCGKKLEVLVQLPKSFTSSVWLVDSMEECIADTVRTNSGWKKTMYNMEMEFQQELDRIREATGTTEEEPLYGVANIRLPFVCEQDIHASNTTCDAKGTLALFVVLKKHVVTDVSKVSMAVKQIGKTKKLETMTHEFA